MKSPLPVLFAAALAFSVSLPARAAEGPTLAFVDTQRILAQANISQASQRELRGRAEAYQRELLEKNTEIETAQKAGKPKAEIERLTKAAERILRPKKEAVEALDRRLTERVKGRIQRAIAEVPAPTTSRPWSTSRLSYSVVRT